MCGAVGIAAVLIVQCLLFGDGGLTALGANFVNMGLVGAIGGYAIYAPLQRLIRDQTGVLIGGMLAAWFSVILASGTFALELAASVGWSGFFNALGWMALVHAGIGVGEALITGVVLRYILLMRPTGPRNSARRDFFRQTSGTSGTRRTGHRPGRIGVPCTIRVGVRRRPGVGRGQLGFLKKGEAVLSAPIPDYQLALPGVSHVKVATAIAGVVGTLVVFGVAWGLARVFSRRSPGTASVAVIDDAGS